MVNIISDYIPPFSPLPNIAPFTYKDGETYLSTLENLRSYVNVTLVDFINTNFSSLGNDFILEIATLTSTVNTALNNQIATVTGQLATQNIAVAGQLATQTTANNTAISNLTTYVNQQVAIIISNSITANDSIVKTLLDNPASLARIALDARYANATYFDAEKYKTGRTDLQAIRAACAAATAAGNANMVRLSARVWDVENGLLMAGYSCGIIGVSAGYTTVPTSSTLFASTQTGAVLDMSNFITPDSFRGIVEFGNFNLQGSNVSDANKNKIGLKNALRELGSTYFHDIAISKTGGAGVDMTQAYLCNFARIVVTTPVDAKLNDVAYMIFRGCNGNRFNGLGFRSLTPSNDTGVSGALIVTSDSTYQSQNNQWTDPWFEYLHIPSNGCFISNAANDQTFRNPYFVDCSKESGSTNTSFAKFMPSVFTDTGANIWDGSIPGSDFSDPTSPDSGIVVTQNHNRIVGPKGYSGSNVILSVDVVNNYISLEGSVAGATRQGVIDNSGNLTNTYFDHINKVHSWGSFSQEDINIASAETGVRYASRKTPANFTAYYGNAGVSSTIIGKAVYHSGDSFIFRDTNLVQFGGVSSNGWSLNNQIQLNNPGTQTVAPPAGPGATLPATPAGYVNITIDGTVRKLPYY